MTSVIAELNKYKTSWASRYEVNSTIKQLKDKLLKKQQLRSQELKKCLSVSEKRIVNLKYNNDIKNLDYLLYLINLEYYEIIGKLK